MLLKTSTLTCSPTSRKNGFLAILTFLLKNETFHKIALPTIMIHEATERNGACIQFKYESNKFSSVLFTLPNQSKLNVLQDDLSNG